MEIDKAVITAAGRDQRELPLQTLIDMDGSKKSVLRIILEEVVHAGIKEICVVVHPGDEIPYAEAAGDHAARLTFLHQPAPGGYGQAVFRARDFIDHAPFLHLVGDHVYVQRGSVGCAEQLVATAKAQSCAISSVQASRESLLPFFGAVGGRREPGHQDLYRVETVIEKPTPTEAEQKLHVPGLRPGHYLCFFGIHVLTPTIMDILQQQIAAAAGTAIALSPALAVLAAREQYLALEKRDWRYDIGSKYGLLKAQLALALAGADRDEVLSELLEFLALRQLHAADK